MPLFEDEPFQVVDQLGLIESADYDAVVAWLKQQFAPSGNEFEWQLRFQNCVQGISESMVEFSGSLRMLADRAYPSWTMEQCKDVLRSQFIYGVQSASVQLHLMKEQPPDLDGALELAVKHEAVESAQKRLHKEKKRACSETQNEIVSGCSLHKFDIVCKRSSGREVDASSRRYWVRDDDCSGRCVVRCCSELYSTQSTKKDGTPSVCSKWGGARCRWSNSNCHYTGKVYRGSSGVGSERSYTELLTWS